MPTHDCIPELRLQDYLNGSLSADATRDVEKHLSECARCREMVGFRPQSSTKPIGDGVAITASAPENSEVTEDFYHEPNVSLGLLERSEFKESLGKIKDYEVLSVLGRGGYGIVFEALDKLLNRRVAIKVLPPELARHETSRRRFLREARAGAAINHPNVVTIHGVDETKDFPFLVMELLGGKSLRERLRREPKLDVMDILRISAQIAQGLAAAQAQGIIHRDVKPGNIMLVDDLPRIKITDFGLARAIVENVNLTSRGVAIGTPGYMSPEQVRGEELDSRSDLFAMGCVIYAMFTGHSPFHGRTMLEIARRVDSYEPPRLHEIDKSIPEFIDAIVARLLMKSPDERYQSAAEVADVLNRHLALLNQTPSDRLPAALQMELFQRRPATNRWRLAATGLTALALLIATGLAFWSRGIGWPFRIAQSTDETAASQTAGARPPDRSPAPLAAIGGSPAGSSATNGSVAGRVTAATPAARQSEVSVAKTGNADCRTIRDALQRVAAGGTIRVLDAAEYEEALLLDDAEHLTGVRLLAPEHARLLFPNAASLVAVHAIPQLEISGLVLVGPQVQMGIEIRGECPGLRLDDVRVQRLPNPEGVGDSSAAVVVRGAGAPDEPIVVRRVTLLDANVGIVIGSVSMESPTARHIIVEECRVQGLNTEDSTLIALVRRCQNVEIRRNVVFQGRRGISFLSDGVAHPDQCSIEHNTWFQATSWIEATGPVADNFSLRVQHNLVINSKNLSPAARERFTKPSCVFVNNVAVQTGAPDQDSFSPLAIQMKDFPFLSLEPKNPNFLRPDFARLAEHSMPLDPVPGALSRLE